MSQAESEADARIVIDDLLRAAGWNPADKSQVRTEVAMKLAGGVLLAAEPVAPYGGRVPPEA
jgi:type I restriction enzyme R subunit